jgi:hypothetical protein
MPKQPPRAIKSMKPIVITAGEKKVASQNDLTNATRSTIRNEKNPAERARMLNRMKPRGSTANFKASDPHVKKVANKPKGKK